MHVSKEGLERIKAKNPLEKVVAESGVKLKKKGRVLVGLCPFHKEKTPSFTITPGKGLFHCFGCDVAGDVIGFVVKHDKLSFREAVEVLCRRAAIDPRQVMEERPRVVRRTPTPLAALTPPLELEASGNEPTAEGAPLHGALPAPQVLARVVEHYHESFCERADAQQYLIRRGITDTDLLRALKVGYADGSLLKLLPRAGEQRDQLREAGILTSRGTELMGGCIVVPIPDPLTGQWTSLYGRGVRTHRHCYLPGPFRGVLNFQAARNSDEVVLTESVLDALSFHQVGVGTAIPLYGTSGLTACHLDLFKREGVRRVILALDSDEAGRRATEAIKEKLTELGLAVRVASFPGGVKDANALLVSRNGDAGDALRRVLHDAEPRHVSIPAPPLLTPTAEPAEAASQSTSSPAALTARVLGREGEDITLNRDGVSYRVKAQPAILGRLRATLRVTRAGANALHLDSIDLFSAKSRADFARRTLKLLGLDASSVDALEADLLALLMEAEKAEQGATDAAQAPPVMTDAERASAMAFLMRSDLLDQIARDIDALGFVGEVRTGKLLYLIGISRLLEEPLSAVILSQSGAGKSGLTVVIERLTAPEDAVLFTRLTPQSLYYAESDTLDHKLVIIEERHGSQEADYSVRILQSRGKLIAAAPVKDPATGTMRTRTFIVVARAAFIEATTASSMNHENATRCFELTMDESVEQTKAIHERQRLMKTEAGLAIKREAEAICARHWNAQRLLQRLPVVIPFAGELSFPATWMRTRRDHARFLNLIEVSAFLHQYQRPRKGGAIVATASDYEAAYDLAAQVLSETLSDIKKPLRDVLARLRELGEAGDGTVCRRELREALAAPDSTVRRHLAELVELEYLTLVDAGSKGAGRAARYRLVERGPAKDVLLGLLTPDALRQRLAGPVRK